ncbi:MAG: membrane dipeptidase [Bryobacteraceae bacterium]
MEIPKGTNASFETSDVWNSLFEMEAVAGIGGGVRAASLCIHCKCSHGCSGLREQVVGAQFWSAYVPAGTAEKGAAVRDTLEQIDAIRRVIKAHSETFQMAHSANDIAHINKEGKFASLIGIEGTHSIDNSLGVLRMLHELGVRYMTLTAADTFDRDQSIGQLVQEMNALGMLVDVSHLPAQTMKTVLEMSKAPVILSNSAGPSGTENERKIPDEVADLIKKRGSVVMVNFYSVFLTPEGAQVRKEMFEAARELKKKHSDEKEYRSALNRWSQEHPIPSGSAHDVGNFIDEVVKMTGIDHVGLGTDSDGIHPGQRQMQDAATYRNITQELRNRGYDSGDIEKMLGGNVMRVLQQAERAAES